MKLRIREVITIGAAGQKISKFYPQYKDWADWYYYKANNTNGEFIINDREGVCFTTLTQAQEFIKNHPNGDCIEVNHEVSS